MILNLPLLYFFFVQRSHNLFTPFVSIITHLHELVLT